MVTITVTRNAQITIPKEVREALGIKEGDRVTIRTEGSKVVVEKVEDVWSNCTDFLPEDFEKILASLRKDARKRFRRLGLTP